MPAAELELEHEHDSQAELVRSWRVEALERAGYGQQAAEQLAELSHVDLHVAVDLLRSGCPEETALQILV
jgi:hypothetical protein